MPFLVHLPWIKKRTDMLYPLKFVPFLKTTVWGGDKIIDYKGIDTSKNADCDYSHVGESWELSGVEGHESVVADGEFAGMTINGMAARFGAELLGSKVFEATGTEFPLLVKFIDAKQDLSIQVHPDDDLARKRYGEGAKGKTEMWYVIDAGEGASLMSGLKKEITPEEYARRVGDNTITDVLERHNIAPGDVFFIPAGRIHAIGAGAFVAEIQQTSDTTYRIYDYNRPGLDGKPRELHTELAKDAIDYKVYDNYKTSVSPAKNTETELVSCRYFTTDLLDLTKPFTKDLTGLDSFLIVIGIAGEGTVGCTIDDTSLPPVPIRRGETVLVPACASVVTFTPSGELKILTSHIG